MYGMRLNQSRGPTGCALFAFYAALWSKKLGTYHESHRRTSHLTTNYILRSDHTDMRHLCGSFSRTRGGIERYMAQHDTIGEASLPWQALLLLALLGREADDVYQSLLSRSPPEDVQRQRHRSHRRQSCKSLPKSFQRFLHSLTHTITLTKFRRFLQNFPNFTHKCTQSRAVHKRKHGLVSLKCLNWKETPFRQKDLQYSLCVRTYS